MLGKKIPTLNDENKQYDDCWNMKDLILFHLCLSKDLILLHLCVSIYFTDISSPRRSFASVATRMTRILTPLAASKAFVTFLVWKVYLSYTVLTALVIMTPAGLLLQYVNINLVVKCRKIRHIYHRHLIYLHDFALLLATFKVSYGKRK